MVVLVRRSVSAANTPTATRMVTMVIHRMCTPAIVTGSLSSGITTMIFPIAPNLTSAMLCRR